VFIQTRYGAILVGIFSMISK